MFDLRNLDEEHAEICRRYTGLGNAILSGRGLPRILPAADSLVQMILLHFAHEEQFLVKLSLSSLQKRDRDAHLEVTAQLFGIEAQLEQGTDSTVFQLLLLGRVWMTEHMYLESEEFECEGLIEEEGSFLVRGALVDRLSVIAGQRS